MHWGLSQSNLSQTSTYVHLFPIHLTECKPSQRKVTTSQSGKPLQKRTWRTGLKTINLSERILAELCLSEKVYQKESHSLMSCMTAANSGEATFMSGAYPGAASTVGTSPPSRNMKPPMGMFPILCSYSPLVSDWSLPYSFTEDMVRAGQQENSQRMRVCAKISYRSMHRSINMHANMRIKLVTSTKPEKASGKRTSSAHQATQPRKHINTRRL